MIREPYNVNPYNTTIDITQKPAFGFSFSGDALAKAQIIIAQNNSDGTPLIESGVPEDGTITNEMRQRYLPGIRNNDEVILQPNLENFEGLQNGADYIWKLRLTEDNATFHHWCHFADDHLVEDDVVKMSKDEYIQYIVNPMLNKHEHHTLLDYEVVSQRLRDYHQAIISYHEDYYRILRVGADDSEGKVQLLLHKPIPDAFIENEKFLLFTNAIVGQYNYATQQVKQGRALDQEIETGIVLTRGIPYDMSKVCRFESGVFVALADNGAYYDSMIEQFIMGDNAKIVSIDEKAITVDVPSTADLSKGWQVNAQLVLNGFAHQVISVEVPPSGDVERLGYYRFTCGVNNNSILKVKEIANYEIRGWNTTLDIYKNILTEVEKIAYSYEDIVYAITCDSMLAQRVIAYEQWNYANGDLRGFIYYADFHRNWEPLKITPNVNFILKSNFYDSNWNYFQTRKDPDVSVVCLRTELNENEKYPIDTAIAFFQGFYNSYGATTIKTHRWTIVKDNELLYDSEIIYDTDLTLRYENFSLAGDYLVTLEIVSQNGNFSAGSCIVSASSEVELPSDLHGTGEVLSQQQAIKLTWPGLLVTEGKITAGCETFSDAIPPYLHIPRNEYLLFDNIGGGKINISNLDVESKDIHHFEMRLSINDFLTYYSDNIFVLSNTQTGQFVSLHKEGTELYWRNQNGSDIKIFDLLQPEFGLQVEQYPKEGIDYRWMQYENQSTLYWTETNTNTNLYIWDISIDITPTNAIIGYRKTGSLWTNISVPCPQNSFDTINFNGNINLYYFAYAIATGKNEDDSYKKFAQLNNGPTWKDESYSNFTPQIIYKYKGGSFISNPSMDYSTHGLGDSGAIAEYLIYRIYDGTLREKIGSLKLTNDLIGLDSYYFIDWTCINRVKPTYEIVPITVDDRASRRIVINIEKMPEWDYWTFVELQHSKDQHYIPGQQWNFHLNLSAGEYAHNITKTYHQGFSAMPKASVGPMNYLSTSLTGLLADLSTVLSPWWKQKGDTEYYQINLADSLKIEKWNQFVYGTNLVLVKDIMGHCFIASLSNNRHTVEDVGELTTNVSFDITQIDDIHNYQIFTSSAQEVKYGIL